MFLALLLAASPVSQAAADYADLDYEACVQRLSTAKLAASERATGELLLGLCHFALGHQGEARASIMAALRRDPKVGAPASASPKELAFIDELRAAVTATPAAKKTPPPSRAREPEKAPVALNEAREKELPADAPAEQAPPPPPPVVFAELPAPLVPGVVTPEPPPVPARARATWLPIVTGAIAVAATGAGVGFGVNAKGLETRANAEPVQVAAGQLALEAHTNATVANVAFVTAGAAAVATLITWLVTK